MQKIYGKNTIVIATLFIIGATMIPMLSTEVMAQHTPSHNNGGGNSHINNGEINSYLARDPPGNIFDIPLGHTISGPEVDSQVALGQERLQAGIIGSERDNTKINQNTIAILPDVDEQ